MKKRVSERGDGWGLGAGEWNGEKGKNLCGGSLKGWTGDCGGSKGEATGVGRWREPPLRREKKK